MYDFYCFEFSWNGATFRIFKHDFKSAWKSGTKVLRSILFRNKDLYSILFKVYRDFGHARYDIELGAISLNGITLADSREINRGVE